VRAPLVAWILATLILGCDSQPTDVAPAEPAAPAPPPAAESPQPEQPEVAPHFMVSGQIDTTVDGKGEGPYHFTTRWHTNVIDNWALQLAGYRGRPDLRYLEIGVFEGRSIVWMLENVLTDPSSRITAIDVFMEDYEQTFDANVRAAGAAERVTKLVGPSQQHLRALAPVGSGHSPPLAVPVGFDIIYVDGSHTADDVLADAVLAWPLLREGGLMIFDDYGWEGRPSGGPLPLELLPRLAIDAFITAYRNEIELVHRGYQVFVRRKPNPCVPKDYCSPLGQYNYFWRALELRRRSDDALIELSDDERKLVELIAKSKQIGDVGFHLDPRFVASPEYVALATRLELAL
jgi:predicted O-methyltransferase YrrM